MAEKTFVLLCDSVADLPQSWYDGDSVKLIPHGLIAGGIEYWDDFVNTLPQPEVCRRMREGEVFSTVQARLDDFVREFTAAAERGLDALYVGFSVGLSGTFGTSQIAAQMVMEKYPHRKMVCVDARGASMGHGIQAMEARKLQEQGLSAEQAGQEVEKRRFNACHFFTVDDLNHLQRGGRLSKSQAVVGTIMGIKPVLYIAEDGRLTPLSKVRGRKNALQELAKLAASHMVGDPKGQRIYLCHAGSESDSNELAQMLRAALPGVEVEIGPLNPVIAVHSGPGTIAMFHWGRGRL